MATHGIGVKCKVLRGISCEVRALFGDTVTIVDGPRIHPLLNVRGWIIDALPGRTIFEYLLEPIGDAFDSRSHWDEWMRPIPGEPLVFEPIEPAKRKTVKEE